jgi:tight adherence protein B
MEGKIDSLTAQGKAQGKFMAGLPVLVGVGLSFLDPVSMSKLISTGIGNVVLGVIIAMQITGFIFINKVTNIDS